MDRTEAAGWLEQRLALRHRHGASLTKHAAALALLAFLLFNCLFTKNFVAWETFSNIFTQATKVALVGLGMTLVMATGEIDISLVGHGAGRHHRCHLAGEREFRRGGVVICRGASFWIASWNSDLSVLNSSTVSTVEFSVHHARSRSRYQTRTVTYNNPDE